jgi:two-component system NtrC family response regulator
MKLHTIATILLAEPHEPTQLVIMLALEPEGFGVLPVRSMSDAIAAARMIRFDVCVCETRLPDGSGLDLVQQLLKIQPSMRILYYAATATPDECELIKQRGHVHLPKPVCMADIKISVNQLLMKTDTA